MLKWRSFSELMKKRYKVLDFQGELKDAFGKPEGCGIWFIWGNSGNGKSSFVVQLCKELLRFGKILYNSLEEGSSLTLQNAFKEFDTEETKRRLLIINEDIKSIEERLSKKRSPDFVVIDSFQYSQMTYESYVPFKEKFTNKLIIFVSHADGSGELVPAMVKSWESEVETAIVNQMTSEGNLGVDTTNPNDKGVKCFIDYKQKVVSTGKLVVSLQVKPYGYAKYIDVKLGFITINQ